MHDLYAVKFKLKKANEWSFASEHLIFKEDESQSYDPKDFLLKTLEQARRVKKTIIERYMGSDSWENDALEFIKISKMNRYNLRRESEVLEFREWK